MTSTIDQKVAHVKAARQIRRHHCHWPGCQAQVPPAMSTRTFSMDSDIGATLASRCDGFISHAGEFVRSMDDATTDDS